MDKGILTLKDIYKFSVLKFGYSVVNEKVPSPILTIFEKEKNDSRRHLNLKIPTFMKTKTQKLPSFMIPKIWNKLPLYLQELNSEPEFKRKSLYYLLNRME